MGFGNWNSQSEDPYAFGIEDDDGGGDCLSRRKRKHTSVAKQKKIFKNCHSDLSDDICSPQEEHSFGSSWHLSQDFLAQVNITTYKQNNSLQVPSEKLFRIFKSRNPFLLAEENFKSQINSKCASQEYCNVECSSETRYLADGRNEEKEKSFTTQNIALFSCNSFIKQGKTNSLTAAKAIVSPKENISSSILRKLPNTSIEETIPASSEDHTLNLRNIRQFHCSQNSQQPSQTPKPFRFQKHESILHKQHMETLAKPKKFFRSQDRNAMSNHNLEYFIRNSNALQDREYFNVEKCLPGNDYPTNNKPVEANDPYSLEADDGSYSNNLNKEFDRECFNVEKCIPGNDYPTNNKPVGANDPYSLEAEDGSYSDNLNKEFKCVNIKNRRMSQDRNRPSLEKCALSSKSQSHYPYSFKMNGDDATTANKNFNCMPKQKGLKSSSAQFSTEVEHTMHRCMQYVNAADIKILHSPRKKNLVSSKIKAVNQPLIDNTTNQCKEENYLPIDHTRDNETFQPSNKSNEVLSLPKTNANVNLNSCDEKGHQVEIKNVSSSLMHTGKDGKSPVTATSKKCSIAYSYVIKNTLSVVTHERNDFKVSNAQSIHKGNKEAYDAHLTSGNTNCKSKDISNKETSKLAHETNTNFSPVVRNPAKPNNHSDLIERKHTIAINATDNNEESNVMPSTYMACNKPAIVKPSLETKELCTPGTNSTCLNVNDLKSLKQTKSLPSCTSFIKHFDIEMEISRSENAQYLIDHPVSESTTGEIENRFKKKTEDSQFSYSPQQEDFQKILQNTFTNGTESTNGYHNTTAITSYEKPKMENHMKIKGNTKRENLVQLKENTIPTKIRTEKHSVPCETDCSTKQAINASNKKICLPIMKKSSSLKNRIFTSNQRKNGRLLYRHKWVDDIGANKHTKLMSPTGLLVQPISSEHEQELRSPLLSVATKHIQTTEVTDKAEAVRDLKNNEIDKDFTIIKNVRKSGRIQELGEYQDFNDDVEYILDALQDSNPITTRCHSALILASKCLTPKFRMHVQAYDTMTKLFCALHDAAEDQSLALCTATIMFILSHYEIITYLNSSSVHLLLRLFNSCLKCEVESTQLQNVKKKVLELCAKVQSHGFIKHLHPENITANQLASEAILNLTSCNEGYLLKDRLREMGGLEHIITAINNCGIELNDFFVQWREVLIDKLRFLNCCLQILECFAYQNEENQLYLLKYGSSFMETMAALFSKCTEEIKVAHQFSSTASVITLELLFTILKVLINLTRSNNDTSSGSFLVARRPEMIYVSLYVLLQAPSYVPEEKKFDLCAMVLMFLINVVEYNTCNRKLIFEAKASDIMIHNSKHKDIMKILVDLFYQQEKLARIEEFYTNAMLDSQIDSELSHETLEPSQDFVASLQERAGQNMKYTMIASYLALLIGYLIVDNEEYEIYVRQCLPQRSFSSMISVLQKMHNFFNVVPDITSKKDITQIQYIIQCLKQSDEKATVVTCNKHQL